MDKTKIVRKLYKSKTVKRIIEKGIIKLPTHLCYFGDPLVLDLEITNVCNLKCPVCPHTISMKRKQGFMSLKQFKFLIDDCHKQVKRLNIFGFGEPFLNRDIFEMIKYAKKKRMYTKTSTNSTMLHQDYKKIIESGLDEIVVSMDGFSKKSHERYRRGSNFEKAREGIVKLCDERDKNFSKIKIELQTLVMKDNEKEINRIKEWAFKKKMKFSPKSFSLGTFTNPQEKKKYAKLYLPTKFGHRYKSSQGKIVVKKKPSICMWIKALAVLWNGDIVLCCYDADGQYKIGNLFQEGGLMKIYKGKRYRRFRSNIIRKKFELCKKCQLCEL